MREAKKPKQPARADRKIRGTVIKSSASGVVLTVAAAVLATPGGLSGMIGTSVAGNIHDREGEYGFPALTPQLSEEEMRGIQSELATSLGNLDTVRAATDGEIERLKVLAEHRGALRVTTAAYEPPTDVYSELAALLQVTNA
ncbi:MAG: hypothetical protein ABUL73_02615 [Alphaproteobacteria bacterium]